MGTTSAKYNHHGEKICNTAWEIGTILQKLSTAVSKIGSTVPIEPKIGTVEPKIEPHDVIKKHQIIWAPLEQNISTMVRK